MKIDYFNLKSLPHHWRLLATFAQIVIAIEVRSQSPSADSFNPSPGNGWPSTSVSCLAVQPDGKILVGGRFNQIGGQGRTNIARLYADGTVETNFHPVVIGGISSSEVKCLAIQTNGQILVGGNFGSLAGLSRKNIGRLNANGAVDTNFNPVASSTVKTVSILPDGKILLSGNFVTVAGQIRPRIALLNTNGTLDTNFNARANGPVDYVLPQADGKILVGGSFTQLGGQSCTNYGRLDTNGVLDFSFSAALVGTVYPRVIQSDGKILVDGAFSCSSGSTTYNLARLNANGSVDSCSGGPVGSCGGSTSIALQSDGKILLAGSFTNLWGQPKKYMARLNGNFTVDTNFTAGADSLVQALAVQPDGKILVGGQFSVLAGVSRSCIGRLSSTNTMAMDSFRYDNSTLAWTRVRSSADGIQPEVIAVTVHQGIPTTP